MKPLCISAAGHYGVMVRDKRPNLDPDFLDVVALLFWTIIFSVVVGAEKLRAKIKR